MTGVQTCALPICLEAEWHSDPLRCDGRYVLGWNDCLRFRYGDQVDWVGHWLIQADSRLGSYEQELGWLRRGAVTDLFNVRHFLCCLGWVDGRMNTRIYTFDQSDSRDDDGVGFLKSGL